MLEELKTAKKVVGIKQLRRALKDRSAKLVFLAKDADPALTGPLLAQCRENGGQLCGRRDRALAHHNLVPAEYPVIFRDNIKAVKQHHSRKEEKSCLLLISL